MAQEGGVGTLSLLSHIAVALVSGMLTSQLFSRRKLLPHSSCMILEGLALGLICNRGADLGRLATFQEFRAIMNPRVFLCIFLPSLFFGDVARLGTDYTRGCFLQCLLVAVLGATFMAFATAWIAYRLLPYSWDWQTCLSFGSALAVTDPAAVVDDLFDSGVSRVCTAQFVGEGFFTAGTAAVLWSFALEPAKGTSLGLGRNSELLRLLTLVAGSLVIGLTVGLVTIVAIDRSRNAGQDHDHMLQLAATSLCAFVAFYVGEHTVACSGAVATAVASLVLANSWNEFSTTWRTFGFVAATLVCFEVGGFVGEMSVGEAIRIEDCGWLVFFYLTIMFLRGVVLVLLYPLIRRTGFSTNWKETVIFWWGGVRGGIGLALALAVGYRQGTDVSKAGRFVFHVGGIAVLTLTINASTTKKLANTLGMMPDDWARAELLAHLRASMHSKTTATFKTLSATKPFMEHKRSTMTKWIAALREAPYDKKPEPQGIGAEDWLGAREPASPMTCKFAPEGKDYARWDHDEKESHDGEADVDPFGDGLPVQHVDDVQQSLSTARGHFYSMMRSRYMEFMKQGRIPRDCRYTTLLLAVVDSGESLSHRPLCDVALLLRSYAFATTWCCNPPATLARMMRNIRDCTLSGEYLVPVRRGNAIFDLFAIVTAIDAHQAVREALASLDFEDKSAARKSVAVVLEESEGETRLLKRFLGVNRVGGSLLGLVRMQQLSWRLLHEAEEGVHRWVRSGALDARGAEELFAELADDHITVWASGTVHPGERTWWKATDTNMPLQVPLVAWHHRRDRMAQGNDRVSGYDRLAYVSDAPDVESTTPRVSDMPSRWTSIPGVKYGKATFVIETE